MKKIFCFLSLISCFLLTTANAQETDTATSQDLSMSVGKATFFKLTNSKRTKPNFIDIGLDMLLQKFLSTAIKKDLNINYDFLEFIPAEQSVVLTNLKIVSKKKAFQGELVFGAFKIETKDFLEFIKQHSFSFAQINTENVTANVTAFRNKKPSEKIKAAAKTIQLSDVIIGPCDLRQEFVEMMKGVQSNENESEKVSSNQQNQPPARKTACLTAKRVFAMDGYLNRSLHKEKYAVTEGVINGIFLDFESAEKPLIFSIGNVNGKTVRTIEELFNALKQ